MRRNFIRIEASHRFEASWVIGDGTEAEPIVIKSGSLEEAAEATAGRRVTVIVPGADVLLHSVVVPSRNQRKIRHAVPYLLEEQFAEEVENLHFATGKHDAEGQVPVAVVARRRMQRWLSWLAGHGINADVMVPDALALPLWAGSWTLLIEDDTSVLRTDVFDGMVCDTVNLETLLALRLDRVAGSPPENIWVIDCRYDNDISLAFLEELEHIHVQVEKPYEPAVAIMARVLSDQSPMNLLQGEFSRREQLGKLWRPWAPAAAMLAAVVVLKFGILLADYWRLSNESERLREQIVATYRQAFPEARSVQFATARTRMEQKLRDLQGGEAASGEFLALLAQVGKQLVKTSGLQLRRVNYRGGSLNLAFSLKDLQGVDDLKRRLTDEEKLAVEIQSATQREGRVEARFQITRTG